MHAQQVHRVSARLLLAFSLIALLTVISGYFQAPQPDEGTAAHIFQLSVAAVGLAGLVFLVTADWKHPRHSARLLLLPAVALVAAFAALYYLEHCFYLQHYR